MARPLLTRPAMRGVLIVGVLLGATSPAAALTAGNAWHIPSGTEPGIATMRSPVHGIAAGASVVVYSGNQFQGTGNPGNQLQTGSAVLYRKIGDAAWTTVPMAFFAQAGNNKYFSATIPGGTAGDAIEYYLRIAYSDHATTFVYGGDDGSHATVDEATAQAAPFAYSVEQPLAPAGAYAMLADGDFQAKLYTDSGHIALGPKGPSAMIGDPGALGDIALAPPAAKIDGNVLAFGKVVGQTTIANGLAIRQQLGGRTIAANVTLGGGVLRYEVTDWGGTAPTETQIAGAADASEHFFGFGEKFDGLDQAGKLVRVLTSDFPGDKGDHSYAVAPWFASSRGYGVYLDSTAESSFDMRASAPDRFTARLLHGTLAFDLVGGPTLLDVLGRYTGLSGRPPLPPPWVFGTWISSDWWRDGGEVRYVVTKMLAENIPVSVFVFDSPWEVAYNDFAWNMTQFGAGGTYEGVHYDGFASLQDMMAFLRASGLKVVVWLTPFVNVRSNDEGVAGQNLGKASSYDAAAAAGYFVRSSPGGAPLVATWWKGDGSPVDFTNPAAAGWFKQQLQALVDQSGGVIGGFKTDDGEADYIPLTASYADGRTGVEMRNGFCFEYLKTVSSVLGADGIVFARSGFAGTQAFPALWAGDNEPNFGTGNGLPSVVSAGLSAAMSGFSIWGSDIGGYQDANPSQTPEDLFMRWTQFGALSPIMQMHRQIGAGRQYPWSYGDAALANYRAYAQLHTQLFPYLYTYAKQSSVDGTPIIRPLPLVDANAPVAPDEYMFGGELVVAPVLTPVTTTRPVYLPPGGWFDYWTNAHVDGGQTVTWTGADATQIPIYVRDGAIVPRIADDTQTLLDATYVGNPAIKTPDGSLDFLIYPSASSHQTIYDGTDVTVAATSDATTIDVTSSARTISLDVYSTQKPVRVERDGTELADGDWSYAGTFVHVSFAHAGGATHVVLDGTGEPQVDPGKPAGCGCSSDRGAGWLVIAAIWLVRRRRRA